jgi:hypothetical protein
MRKRPRLRASIAKYVRVSAARGEIGCEVRLTGVRTKLYTAIGRATNRGVVAAGERRAGDIRAP